MRTNTIILDRCMETYYVSINLSHRLTWTSWIFNLLYSSLIRLSALCWYSPSILTVSVCHLLSAFWIAVSPYACTDMICICWSAVRQSSIIFTNSVWPRSAAVCRGVSSYLFTISSLSLSAEDCRDVSSVLIISVWSLDAAQCSVVRQP